MKDVKRNKYKYMAGIVALIVVVFFVWLFLKKPTHEATWEVGQEQLPFISVVDDTITIDNIRDFSWTGAFEAEQNYISETYSLSSLETTDVFISHFDDFEGLAHIFLSFGFSDGKHIVVSLESRRKEGETFSPLKGMFRSYEIIYVVGTERDIVGVRTGHRNERVYLYPTIATPEVSQNLFLKLAEDINAVYRDPIFYNTVTHNCTNRLTRRVEEISDARFPLTYKSLLPGYFDEVLYEMKLISQEGDFESVKLRHLIDNTSVDVGSPTYSNDLRQGL